MDMYTQIYVPTYMANWVIYIYVYKISEVCGHNSRHGYGMYMQDIY